MYGAQNSATLEMLFTQPVFRKAGVNYALANYPGWSFTRASTGYAQNSSGALVSFGPGTPRITDLGLLIEESQTNLALGSTFGTIWSRNGAITSVTTNADTAPDGTLSASLVTINANTAALYQPIAVSASTAYTFSFWAKRGTTLTDVSYAVYDATHSAWIIFQASYIAQTNTSTYVRVSAPFTTPAGCTSVNIYAVSGISGGSGTMYLWGGQLEAGTFPTSNITTTSSAATRAADAATLTYSPNGSAATVTYGTNSTASPSPTSPINLGSSSSGAWVGNYVRKLVVTP
jgi:hypothetical protein